MPWPLLEPLRHGVNASVAFFQSVTLPAIQGTTRRLLRAERARLNAFLRDEGIAFVARGRDAAVHRATWEAHVARTFDPKDPDRFYGSLTREQGALALAVNVEDQFRRVGLLSVLSRIDLRGLRVVDYGAGTAALSLAFGGAARSLVLSDVENLVARFRRWKAGSDPRVRLVHLDALDAEPDGSADVVLCVDVLEHLREPSRVFSGTVARLVRPGGLLFLQAPWGVIPEHLPEAPVDWKTNGGAERLARDFVRLEVLNPLIAAYAVSGVYRRRVAG